MVALALCTSCVILPLSTTRGWVIYHNWVFDGGDGVWNRSCINSLSNSYAMEPAPIPSWRSPFRTAALPTEAAKSRHSTLQSTAPSPRRLQRSAMNRQREKQIIDSVLGASVYDRRIRPGGLNGTSKWEMVLRWVIDWLRWKFETEHSSSTSRRQVIHDRQGQHLPQIHQRYRRLQNG